MHKLLLWQQSRLGEINLKHFFIWVLGNKWQTFESLEKTLPLFSWARFTPDFFSHLVTPQVTFSPCDWGLMEVGSVSSSFSWRSLLITLLPLLASPLFPLFWQRFSCGSSGAWSISCLVPFSFCIVCPFSNTLFHTEHLGYQAHPCLGFGVLVLTGTSCRWYRPSPSLQRLTLQSPCCHSWPFIQWELSNLQ